MPLPLAAATNHTLLVAAIAIAAAFGLGTLGHIHGSRTMILAAILAIGAICLYFVASGEIQTFG